MNYYGYSGLSEEERRQREEMSERSRKASRRYWDNITPEQREERKRKAAETRRRTREALEARLERERSYRERAKKAAATRRRNNGTEGLSPWQLEEHKLEKRREYKRRYNEKAKADRKAAAAVAKPTEWRNVPGDPKGSRPHEFRGIPAGVLSKRNAKFWAFVDRTGGIEACWPWHGSYYYDHHRGKRSKYGSAYFERGYTTGAHRVAWMLTHGFYIPGYLVVDHLCNTPWCVNPEHLEVVTPGENSRRTHHREPEITRPSTSSEPPWDDRWYPFGRRKYDEHGNLKEKYRDQEIDDDVVPPLPMLNPDDYPADRRIHFPVVEPPLIPDDEEF